MGLWEVSEIRGLRGGGFVGGGGGGELTGINFNYTYLFVCNILIIRHIGSILNTQPHQQFAVIVFYRVLMLLLLLLIRNYHH